MGVAPGEPAQAVRRRELRRHCVGFPVLTLGAAVPDLDTVDVLRRVPGAVLSFRMLERVREYGDTALCVYFGDGPGECPRADGLRDEPSQQVSGVRRHLHARNEQQSGQAGAVLVLRQRVIVVADRDAVQSGLPGARRDLRQRHDAVRGVVRVYVHVQTDFHSDFLSFPGVSVALLSARGTSPGGSGACYPDIGTSARGRASSTVPLARTGSRGAPRKIRGNARAGANSIWRRCR